MIRIMINIERKISLVPWRLSLSKSFFRSTKATINFEYRNINSMNMPMGKRMINESFRLNVFNSRCFTMRSSDVIL